MKRKKKGIIYAETHDELTLKMTGYFHDHCYHLYYGKVENVPEKLLEDIDKNEKFVFIYEEDIPIVN